jgi:hypothetical protein
MAIALSTKHQTNLILLLNKLKIMTRRNLSGIYIFEKFEGEEKREPTCFEDCTEATQDKWLDSLENEALKNLAKHLGNALVEVGDYAGVIKGQQQ